MTAPLSVLNLFMKFHNGYDGYVEMADPNSVKIGDKVQFKAFTNGIDATRKILIIAYDETDYRLFSVYAPSLRPKKYS